MLLFMCGVWLVQLMEIGWCYFLEIECLMDEFECVLFDIWQVVDLLEVMVIVMLLFVMCWLMLCLGEFWWLYFDIEVCLLVLVFVVDFSCECVDVVICLGGGFYLGFVVEKLMLEMFFVVG